MCVMASANHLMMVFIGIEMASLPSYALAGFLKGRRQSSEAALKYVVYGGGAAGRDALRHQPDRRQVRHRLSARHRRRCHGAPAGSSMPILLLGRLFILIGIAFKLAAVPFHFWCPDVFEGAAAEVAGFLSVASKGAALALLARLCWSCWRAAPGIGSRSGRRRPLPGAGAGLLRRPDGDLRQPGGLPADQPQTAAGLFDHRPCRLHDDGPGDADDGRRGAVLFYLVAYLFMNLGAFAIVAFLRNLTGSEDLQGLPRPGLSFAVAGAHAGGFPAEPARHSAAGRLRGQVPDLQRPVQVGTVVWRQRSAAAEPNHVRIAGDRRPQYRGQRDVLHQGAESHDYRKTFGGSRRPAGNAVQGAGAASRATRCFWPRSSSPWAFFGVLCTMLPARRASAASHHRRCLSPAAAVKGSTP